MKHTIAIFFFIIIILPCEKTFSQIREWEWVNIINFNKSYGPSVIKTDNNSNIYITGNCGNSVNFGDTTISSTELQIFLAKYDSLGNLKWLANIFSNNSDCAIFSMDVRSNSILTTGFFSEKIYIGDTTLSSYNDRDLFVAKYDTSGNFNWAFKVSGIGTEDGTCINTYSDSEILLSGVFTDNIVLGDTILVSSGTRDFFISKYNETGQFDWIIHGSGEGFKSEVSLICDNFGFIYAKGRYEGSLSINGFSLSNSTISSFLMKLSQSGKVQWLKNLPEPWYGRVSSIITDYENNLYIGGTFLHPELPTRYIMKFDSNGNYIWSEGNGGFHCYSLTIDEEEYIYAAGFICGKAKIGSYNFNTDSAYGAEVGWVADHDIVVTKLDFSGNIVQAVHVDDYYHTKENWRNQYTHSISSNRKNIFTSGKFDGKGIFNGVDTLSGSGIFLAKLIMENPISIIANENDFDISYLYPNPASEFIILNIPVRMNDEFALTIINANGMIVKTLNVSNKLSFIDIGSFPPGIYFVIINDYNNTFIKKFIKL